jgi:hypothetical protein
MSPVAIDRMDTMDSLTRSTDIRGAPVSVPVMTILYHPEIERIGDACILGSLLGGHSVDLSRVAPSFARPGTAEEAPLQDEHLSRKPIRLLPIERDGLRVNPGDSPTKLSFRGAAVEERLDFSAAARLTSSPARHGRRPADASPASAPRR